MSVLTHPRPRLSAEPVGKSGHRTLELPTLVQDKSRRALLAATDRAAFLAAGGLQDATTELTKDVELQLEVHGLFDTCSWDQFSQL